MSLVQIGRKRTFSVKNRKFATYDLNGLRNVPLTTSIDLKFGRKLFLDAYYNVCENKVKRVDFAILKRFLAFLAGVS